MRSRSELALYLGAAVSYIGLGVAVPNLLLSWVEGAAFLLLAVSITLSILILMTSLFIQAPLEFSAFPRTTRSPTSSRSTWDGGSRSCHSSSALTRPTWRRSGSSMAWASSAWS